MEAQYQATVEQATVGQNAPLTVTVDRRLRVDSVQTVPVGGSITYTDKTITSASGSSQTLAAASATRKSFLIKNGASATGVNLNGGTAVIGGAATLTLQPYESLFLSGADCPVGAITVISTVTAYISALEGA